MVLDKAIEMSITYTRKHSADMSYEELDAHRIGIEAMKRLKWTRECPFQSPYELLLSETEK